MNALMPERNVGFVCGQIYGRCIERFRRQASEGCLVLSGVMLRQRTDADAQLIQISTGLAQIRDGCTTSDRHPPPSHRFVCRKYPMIAQTNIVLSSLLCLQKPAGGSRATAGDLFYVG